MTDDWDDDDYDDEGEDDDAIPYSYICPECGAEVFQDCGVCPYCEMYIIPVLTEHRSIRPMWWGLLGFAGIIGTIIVLSGLMNFF